jgi:hypothetical protein
MVLANSIPQPGLKLVYTRRRAVLDANDLLTLFEDSFRIEISLPAFFKNGLQRLKNAFSLNPMTFAFPA